MQATKHTKHKSRVQNNTQACTNNRKNEPQQHKTHATDKIDVRFFVCLGMLGLVRVYHFGLARDLCCCLIIFFAYLLTDVNILCQIFAGADFCRLHELLATIFNLTHLGCK